jgi:hypothetical protein
MKTLLFYDISELGWVRYLSAHINYLKDRKIAICTNKSREVFYRGIVDEFLPIPQKYYELFSNYESDGNCLFNPNTDEIISDHSIISQPFKDEYPDYEVVTDYSMFYRQRKFQPYIHSIEAEEYSKRFRDVILVFPRYREFKFGRRNIKKDYWVQIIDTLCKTYSDFDIITMGGIRSTYDIKMDYKNYHNLISNDNVLDVLVSLCNMGKVVSTFGTESGISLVATICKSNSFIVGQDKDRIMYENFCKANIFCYKVMESEDGYIIKDFDHIEREFIKFTNLMILLKQKNI